MARAISSDESYVAIAMTPVGAELAIPMAGQRSPSAAGARVLLVAEAISGSREGLIARYCPLHLKRKSGEPHLERPIPSSSTDRAVAATR